MAMREARVDRIEAGYRAAGPALPGPKVPVEREIIFRKARWRTPEELRELAEREAREAAEREPARAARKRERASRARKN